jgi:ADP-ribosylation/crystallin J1
MDKREDLQSLRTMILAIIYGLAVGDALGVPVEFEERDTYCLTDMIGYGTYHQPPGTWSDDTSLTLALMEHLGEKSDLNALMDKFVAYRDGYLTPFGYCFDIGIATNEAIERYLSGISPEECGGQDERSNGNGALMRISPLVFLLMKNFNLIDQVKVIKKYTIVTHRHPRSIVASVIYLFLLKDMLFNDLLPEVLACVQIKLEKIFSQNSEYWEEYENYFKEIFDQEFYHKSREEIKSTGYVVDTLKACLWCLGTTDNFKDAVLKAVNLGEDTDTIGAITGTLASAKYSMESIPNEWIVKLANKSLIDEKCEQLFNGMIDV